MHLAVGVAANATDEIQARIETPFGVYGKRQFKMNTPPQKPPTRESVEAAQRFAVSLPALPALPALPEHKPQLTDYERGFGEGYLAGFSTGYQSGVRKLNFPLCLTQSSH
jgi:hypothetical protein